MNLPIKKQTQGGRNGGISNVAAVPRHQPHNTMIVDDSK
jgi:hypothetical protein